MQFSWTRIKAQITLVVSWFILPIMLCTDVICCLVSVAQVRIVFQLAPPRHSTAKLPDFLLHPLLYVQPFRIVTTPDDLEDTWLWKLERVYAAAQPKTRTGFVIPITEVTHTAELVPVYGEKVDRSLTSATSQEHYDHFYLNHYADKEMYNALHESLDTEYTL
jgi:hypothetical protein